MTKFEMAVKNHLARLEQYTPIVERVHGSSHPEFYDVRKLFDQLNEKIKAVGTAEADLTEEFQQLRKVTNNYTVPSDTCESYEAVYLMLKELDDAYHE
ncbi:MAG: iron-sulfur cluster repair di-iron protein, ric [Firmicutes bacterium]|nr:iron-sulfur cluster repair di-iron protein, ric [Bacillota bacterium]